MSTVPPPLRLNPYSVNYDIFLNILQALKRPDSFCNMNQAFYVLTPSRFIGHEEALNYAAKLSISKSTGER